MAKEERMQILELLKEGKITVDEAERLLNAIDSNEEVGKEKNKKRTFKMLKVIVDSEEGDKVRVQIPIEFAKLLKADKFNLKLDKTDLDVDTIIKMIDSGAVGEIVNIESSDGEVVKIVVE